MGNRKQPPPGNPGSAGEGTGGWDRDSPRGRKGRWKGGRDGGGSDSLVGGVDEAPTWTDEEGGRGSGGSSTGGEGSKGRIGRDGKSEHHHEIEPCTSTPKGTGGEAGSPASTVGIEIPLLLRKRRTTTRRVRHQAIRDDVRLPFPAARRRSSGWTRHERRGWESVDETWSEVRTDPRTDPRELLGSGKGRERTIVRPHSTR